MYGFTLALKRTRSAAACSGEKSSSSVCSIIIFKQYAYVLLVALCDALCRCATLLMMRDSFVIFCMVTFKVLLCMRTQIKLLPSCATAREQAGCQHTLASPLTLSMDSDCCSVKSLRSIKCSNTCILTHNQVYQYMHTYAQ